MCTEFLVDIVEGKKPHGRVKRRQVKVKFFVEQAMKAQRESRDINLLFL